MLSRVLALGGYGLWTWLGLALALGIYPAGRGEALVPLTWGAILVSIAPVLAWLPGQGVRHWLGWRLGRDRRPTVDGLVALGAYLPMLAVAGLARGDNLFWATRVSGAALAAISVFIIVYAMRPRAGGPTATQPSLRGSANRFLGAMYSGGLWLWLCTVGQETGPSPFVQPIMWIVLLQLVALATGLLDLDRWRATISRQWETSSTKWRSSPRLLQLATVLMYVVPVLVILLTPVEVSRLWPAAVAATSWVLGRCMEQHLFHAVVARESSHLTAV